MRWRAIPTCSAKCWIQSSIASVKRGEKGDFYDCTVRFNTGGLHQKTIMPVALAIKPICRNAPVQVKVQWWLGPYRDSDALGRQVVLRDVGERLVGAPALHLLGTRLAGPTTGAAGTGAAATPACVGTGVGAGAAGGVAVAVAPPRQRVHSGARGRAGAVLFKAWCNGRHFLVFVLMRSCNDIITCFGGMMRNVSTPSLARTGSRSPP